VAIGREHTCTVVDGGISCWGGNAGGQLGNGGIVGTPNPVQVSGLSTGVTGISVGIAKSFVRSTPGAVAL